MAAFALSVPGGRLGAVSITNREEMSSMFDLEEVSRAATWLDCEGRTDAEILSAAHLVGALAPTETARFIILRRYDEVARREEERARNSQRIYQKLAHIFRAASAHILALYLRSLSKK